MEIILYLTRVNREIPKIYTEDIQEILKNYIEGRRDIVNCEFYNSRDEKRVILIKFWLNPLITFRGKEIRYTFWRAVRDFYVNKKEKLKEKEEKNGKKRRNL